MTNNTKDSLAALTLDLKRVALALHRNSSETAQRFLDEALKRRAEIKLTDVDRRTKLLLVNFPDILDQKDSSRYAEDMLMYSILLTNSLKKY